MDTCIQVEVCVGASSVGLVSYTKDIDTWVAAPMGTYRVDPSAEEGRTERERVHVQIEALC